MNISIVELLLVSLTFVSVTYIFYVFTSEIGTAAADFKEKQAGAEDTTLAELYINISPEAFFFLRVLASVLLFIFGTFALNSVLGLIFAVCGFFGPAMLLENLRYKRVKKIEEQMVEGLELLGNGLKSGLTLPQAVEALVREFPPPLCQEFSLVMSETRLGVDFNEALLNMANRLDSLIVKILASGVAITKQCGGDMTEIFQNIAQTIREQAVIEGKLDAVTSQGRFQGLVLSIMPFALVFLLYFIDRAHVETLFGYTLGLWAIGIVIVMVGLAQLWIRKLLAIDV